ncbi:glycoside hydrolase family 3 N-terminal domain-containing protein [Staphylococcus agnetis]|uniref:glycoside hydrolase family 3 N-terminal domain-containing protein n=1 Tax=Staphylococcus agnetis TaxID=985762 RepID=UPI0023AAE224|nr:glycoside hydrolase family 3 N-terminal domain-containing protein [Staphylococcus agnetis]
MADHIAQPAYSKLLNPKLTDADILPTSLSQEVITDLLKTDIKFNGLVITDASHMLGMTASMRREEYVPLSIAAGCDMFLFSMILKKILTSCLTVIVRASLLKRVYTMPYAVFLD